MLLHISEQSWSREHTPSMTAKNMFYYIQSGGHFYCDSQYVTNRKDYNAMLLVYTLKGIGHLKYLGQSYDLTEGQAFLIDCSEEHYYASDKKELWEFNWIHFNGSQSKNYVEQILKISKPVFELKEKSNILINMQKIHELLLQRDARLDIIASSLVVESLTELMLLSFHGNIEEVCLPETVSTCMHIIEYNYTQDINLTMLSKEVCISKYHLARLFKKYTGYGLYEYLINYRLSQAKSLLNTTYLPVGEIAQKVGFESTSQFIKIFKKNENTTPLQFRKYWH